jgi:hypothetical protein
MNARPFPPSSDPHDDYAWLDEGSLPHSREDRIVEAIALFALVFALCAGLVIALLPVSAQAVPADQGARLAAAPSAMAAR